MLKLLFWACVAAIAVAQFEILRSTRRARAQGATEWVFAVLPVFALVALLWATWGQLA